MHKFSENFHDEKKVFKLINKFYFKNIHIFEMNFIRKLYFYITQLINTLDDTLILSNPHTACDFFFNFSSFDVRRNIKTNDHNDVDVDES